jgi:hypothetical protein
VKYITTILACASLCACSTYTLTLNDGSEVEGEVLENRSDVIVMGVGDGKYTKAELKDGEATPVEAQPTQDGDQVTVPWTAVSDVSSEAETLAIAGAGLTAIGIVIGALGVLSWTCDENSGNDLERAECSDQQTGGFLMFLGGAAAVAVGVPVGVVGLVGMAGTPEVQRPDVSVAPWILRGGGAGATLTTRW